MKWNVVEVLSVLIHVSALLANVPPTRAGAQWCLGLLELELPIYPVLLGPPCQSTIGGFRWWPLTGLPWIAPSVSSMLLSSTHLKALMPKLIYC